MGKRAKRVPAISDELVMSRIHTVRGHKVMLDRDLAELYGVPTKALKQAVRRNMERFPEDFMFEMSQEELEQWRSQTVTSNPGVKMGLRYAPFCFTEHGVLMLSSVLNSAAAIAVNIQVIRVFTKMRELLVNHKDLLLALEKLRGTVSHNSRDIKVIFNILKKMQEEERNRALLAQVPKKRPPIGFKKDK
jgi:translation initiation factor 2 alpha subunit (eIF-2alpha)